MKLAQYLGHKASSLLGSEPFKGLAVERTVDDDSDPPEVRYVFKNCGFEFNCDREDERINTLFFGKEAHAWDFPLDIAFSLCREEVLSRFGSPSKSGEAFSDPILGDFGAWDRFQYTDYTLHIQYCVTSDGIEKITFMRNDVAP